MYFFQTNASLINWSLFFTVITIDLISCLSLHFSTYVLWSWFISLLVSCSIRSCRWIGTFLPFCCIAIALKFLTNSVFTMWFFNFLNLLQNPLQLSLTQFTIVGPNYSFESIFRTIWNRGDPGVVLSRFLGACFCLDARCDNPLL